VEKKGYFSSQKLIIASAVLLLVFSFFLVYLWLNFFLITMSEFPINGIGMDWGKYCQLQINLSNYFSGWSQRSSLPFLILFHFSVFLFLFRSREKALLPSLPLEFAILNFLFLILGTTIFIFGIILEIIISLGMGISSGSESILLLSCKTTRGFYPGLAAAILAAAGLFVSQATGWLRRLIARVKSGSKLI